MTDDCDLSRVCFCEGVGYCTPNAASSTCNNNSLAFGAQLWPGWLDGVVEFRMPSFR